MRVEHALLTQQRVVEVREQRPFRGIRVVLDEGVEDALVLSERHRPFLRLARRHVTHAIDGRPDQVDQLQDFRQPSRRPHRRMKPVVLPDRFHRIAPLDRAPVHCLNVVQRIQLARRNKLGRGANARALLHAPNQRPFRELLSQHRRDEGARLSRDRDQFFARQPLQRFAHRRARNA